MKALMLVVAVTLLVLQLVKAATKIKGVPTPAWVEIVISVLAVVKIQLVAAVLDTPNLRVG